MNVDFEVSRIDYILQIVFLYAYIYTTITDSEGFLLGTDDCPAPPQCYCITGLYLYPAGTVTQMQCQFKLFSSVPIFRNTSVRHSYPMELWLSGNLLSTIPANAFFNLQTFTNNAIYIWLNYNNLTDGSIDINAFGGIEDLVMSLFLDGNKLMSIPRAVTRLNHLETLGLYGNPIVTIAADILISIRHNLLSLQIPLQNVTTWPSAFRYLTLLKRLWVMNYKYILPLDAFSGFRSTLQELYLDDFINIPRAVCDLTQLQILWLGSASSLPTRNLLPCSSPKASVIELRLKNTNFSQFPDVFKSFPNLQKLDLISTELSLIDDSMIPAKANITRLSLDNNKLTWVPGAVNGFPSLEILSLRGNLIRSIERHSLENLQYLETVDLTFNPIYFISKNAFWNLPALRSITLDSTKLTTIPAAVQSLPNFQYLNLRRNAIICDCDAPWLKLWAANTTVTVDGTCSGTSEDIDDFLMTSLQKCP